MITKVQNFEPLEKILDVLPGFVYQLKMNPQGEFTWLYLSKGVEHILGLPVEEALQDANRLLSLIHPDDYDRVLSESIAIGEKEQSWFGEFRMHTVDGREMYFEAHDTSRKQVNGDIVFTGFANNVSERRELEHRLDLMAHYDALTGLLNRSSFYEILENTIRTSHRRQQHFALLFIDLDHFKPVNDNFGHRAGDILLQFVSGRIKQSLRTSDTCCRYGGDEFLVVLPDVGGMENPARVAEKIIQQLEQPFEVEGHILHISASIGISLYPDHGNNPDTLISLADQTMYQAKHSGGGNVRIHED
ncbi:MAG: hypothetical protein CVU35_03960 [Betaproteobacteria bacterium HGW-Betaproteobacteria-8]|nr:MAG: hypothetical protein CVU35_03960 [Betaproteobacteria bacterium HGW-Betaproteobacteria-8]